MVPERTRGLWPAACAWGLGLFWWACGDVVLGGQRESRAGLGGWQESVTRERALRYRAAAQPERGQRQDLPAAEATLISHCRQPPA